MPRMKGLVQSITFDSQYALDGPGDGLLTGGVQHGRDELHDDDDDSA